MGMSNKMVLLTLVLHNLTWGGLQPVTAWSWWMDDPSTHSEEFSNLPPPFPPQLDVNDGSLLDYLGFSWNEEGFSFWPILRGAATAPVTGS